MHFFILHEISPEEVINCNCSITLYSTPGMDGILPQSAKLAMSIFHLYFATIFNKCIQQEIYTLLILIFLLITTKPKKTT